METSRSAKIRKHFEESIRAFSAVSEEGADAILRAADLIAEAFQKGGKLLICGNGGSAADAQHMAAELVSCLHRNKPRAALPALALTTDTSFLTAYANDVAYGGVFERQVEALGKKNDVLIGITTSGTSENVLRAFAAARSRGMVSVGLTGQRGLDCEADCVIQVPSNETQCIQEAHLAIEHILCELVEDRLFPAPHAKQHSASPPSRRSARAI